MTAIDRREFLRLGGSGAAGAVLISSLWPGRASARTPAVEDFVFLQMSDTHWGYSGPAVNPDADVTLEKAVASVNRLSHQPDFVVFTGDLSHTTDDPTERRQRLAGFHDIARKLKVKTVRYMPGEHDASLDHGEAFRERFGDTHYTFDHKGVHFIALDNVSDPTGSLGTDQLAWLEADLRRQDHEQPIVVLTHRPLFDLAPQWDWATRDGAAALELLQSHEYVTVFYGHIHQEHHQQTGHIAHHAAKSLIFALPAPMSVPKKAPIPWDASKPYDGLGYRTVTTRARGTNVALAEHAVTER